jgi:hypothetical protein
MALEEERTEAHQGLYFTDQPSPDGKTIRLFLPNFFNTFREWLASRADYATLVGNLGAVCELMGKAEEAASYVAEAKEFMPWRPGQSGYRT